MRVTCDVHALLRAATACTSVVRADKDKPVLSCVKLSTDGDRLCVLAYDTETWVRQVVVGVQVDESGACLIPARNLVSWLTEFQSGRLSLTHDGRRTHAEIGTAERNFAVFPLDEYPEPDPTVHVVETDTPHHGTTVHLEPNAHRADILVTVGHLNAALARVLFCVDKKDSSKFTTVGVCFKISDCRLAFAATDTNHVATTMIETANVGPELREVVPSDALKLLPVVLAAENEITIALSEHSIQFRGTASELGTRLLAGSFPPVEKYAQLVAPNNDRKITLPTYDFTEKVRQATAGITEGDHRFRIDLAFEGGMLSLSVPVADAPMVAMTIDETPELRFSTYHPALLDFLRVALAQGSKSLDFYYPLSPAKPWLLRALPMWDYYPARMAEPKQQPRMEATSGTTG